MIDGAIQLQLHTLYVPAYIHAPTLKSQQISKKQDNKNNRINSVCPS